jgi:prefoldin subunit 5
MQTSLARRSISLLEKIPDIHKTLETVQFLRLRGADSSPLETTFELNDTLYAKASVEPTEEVYLWLGANVMLAYPLEEAEGLLKEKLEKAERGLKEVREDEGFVREQITVS